MELNCDEIHRVPEHLDDFQGGSNEVVLLEDSSVFQLGETFDSYDELLKRLASHSKQSLVHYWRRDSRTVQGAFMKTARPIESKLVYYSVKYACVYGGQKFFPRGKGQRHSMTMRTDCPAHIMVRASKSGRQLEVISVCNAHNHPVSKELYRKLPQDRRLSPTIKQEVLDLLRLGVERKCVRDYVRATTGKILTNKDLLNLGAGDRRPRSTLKADRALTLLRAVTQLDSNADGLEKQREMLGLTESTDSQESSPDLDSDRPAKKGRWKRVGEPVAATDTGDEELLVHDSDGVDETLDCTLHDSMTDPVGGEVEIFYEEEPQDSKNLIEYLYPSVEDSYAVKNENGVSSSDIVIENIGLVDTNGIEIQNTTNKDISNALEIIQQEHSLVQNDNCLTDSLNMNTNHNKVKLKFVNLDTLFPKSDNGKMLSPDRNENTLFHSFTDANDNGVVNSEIDLRNILVIRDPLSDGDICSVPIQMLKLGANGTVELKSNSEMDEYISLQDDEGILTFADSDQNIIIDNSLNEHNISDLDPVSNNSLNFINSKSMMCDVCGKTGSEISKHLQKLRREKEVLEKEVKSLRMKRNKLKSDIKTEKDYSKRLAKVAADRNAKFKKTLESFEESDDIDPERVQYIFVP